MSATHPVCLQRRAGETKPAFAKRLAGYSARVLAVARETVSLCGREEWFKAALRPLVPLNSSVDDVEDAALSLVMKLAFQCAIYVIVSDTAVDALLVDVLSPPARPLFADDARTSLFGRKTLLPNLASALHTYAPVTCFSCVLAPLLALRLTPQHVIADWHIRYPNVLKRYNRAPAHGLALHIVDESKRMMPVLAGPPTTRPQDMRRFCEEGALELFAAHAPAEDHDKDEEKEDHDTEDVPSKVDEEDDW
jgi:hypothetical protein